MANLKKKTLKAEMIQDIDQLVRPTNRTQKQQIVTVTTYYIMHGLSIS
jgi:predicted component of type VI protein secretion system